jgi:signal transduction histidine kinase
LRSARRGGVKAKDDFLAASHELRTPLTPVLMAAEDLCADPDLPSWMTSTVGMMRRNIN